MVRTVLRPVVEEPGDVLAVHLEFLECGVVHCVSMSEPGTGSPTRRLTPPESRPPSIAPCPPATVVPIPFVPKKKG